MIDLRAIGADITEFKRNEDGRTVKYTVDKIYPFYVKAHDSEGRTECFNVGDLVALGVIKQNKTRYGSPYRMYKGGVE